MGPSIRGGMHSYPFFLSSFWLFVSGLVADAII